MNSSVSVVIPTYNGARFIREALESVFAQTLLPREIIVVDDASTDETPDLVRDIAGESPVPLRLICLDANSGGPARPMNVGVSEASTELVAILDQDDVYDRENLQRQADAIRACERAAFVFSWCGRLGEDTTQQSEPAKQQLVQAGWRVGDAYVLRGADARRLLLEQEGGMVVGFPAMMFRKSTWQAVGSFRETLRIAVDYDFELKAATVGDVLLLPRIGYRRRLHNSNACRDLPTLVHEVALVKALFAIEHPGLLPDEGGAWGDIVRSAAWHERRAGRYSAATALLCHALMKFPDKAATLSALAKVVAYCVSYRQARSR